MAEPVVVGISGTSGSGKSFICQNLHKKFGDKTVVILQDNYYKDQTHIPIEQREKLNYDHPYAVDFDLLINHITLLKNKKSIKQPQYDFKNHNRKKHFETVNSAKIILLDGILIFTNPKLRALCDLKIFVNTPLDICFIRRLLRDKSERGRSVDSIIWQYLDTVRPMFYQHVQDTMQYADIIIDGESPWENSIEKISGYLHL
ncbi:uridine kinase [candidate division KSB1 bacterium]|nr:uridine kinase [candidate division KSB1 bacterium]